MNKPANPVRGCSLIGVVLIVAGSLLFLAIGREFWRDATEVDARGGNLALPQNSTICPRCCRGDQTTRVDAGGRCERCSIEWVEIPRPGEQPDVVIDER